MLYIENLKTPLKKLLELINEFSKISGYKISTQKSVSVYTDSGTSEKENYCIHKSNFLTIKIGINLTKQVKNVHNENYKSLMKEIEEETKGKMPHVHGSKELTLLK